MPDMSDDWDRVGKLLKNKTFMDNYFKEHPTNNMLLKSINNKLKR